MAFTKALFSVLLLQYALGEDPTPEPTPCKSQTVDAGQYPFELKGSLEGNSSCRIDLVVPADSYLTIKAAMNSTQIGDLITFSDIHSYNNIVLGNGNNATSFVYPPARPFIIEIKTGRTTRPDVDIAVSAVTTPNTFAITADTTKKTEVNQQAFKIKLSDLKPNPYHITAVNTPAPADPVITSGNIVLTTLGVGQVDRTSWMNVFLFDKGNNFLNTLADVVYAMNGRYDQQEQLYVFQANADAADSSNLISINNQKNLAEYTGAQDFLIPTNNGETSYELDATVNSPAVVTISTNAPLAFLTGVTFTDATAILKLWAGEPIPDETAFTLAEYQAKTIANHLPQALYATSISISLDKGKATLKFMTDETEAGWQVMRPGRQLFFSTQNYLLAEAAGYNHLSLVTDENNTLYDITIGKPLGNPKATCRFNGLGENNSPFKTERDVCKENTTFAATSLFLSMSPGDAPAPLGALLPITIKEAIPSAPPTPGPGETEGTTPPTEPVGVIYCTDDNIQQLIKPGVDWKQYRFAASSSCYMQFDFTATTAMRIQLKAEGIAVGELIQLQYGADSNNIIRADADGTLNVDITWSITDHVVLRVLTSDKTKNIFWLQTTAVPIDLGAKVPNNYPLKAGATGLYSLDQINDFLPGYSNVFKSDTGVTLAAAFYPDETVAAQAASLFVYEGEGANRVLKGSVLSLLSSKPYTSTKTLTIYMAHPEKMNSPTQIFANDNSNLKAYPSYSAQWPPVVNRMSVILDATNGATALTFADTKDQHRAFVVDNIKFSGNNQTLSVVAGAPTTESKELYSFSSKDSTVYTDDMSFPGYVKTLSLDRGTAVVDLIFEGDPMAWSTVTRKDRTGAIMTPNYPSGASTGDYVVSFLNDNDQNNYKYIFELISSDADSKMSVSFWDGEKWGDESVVEVKSDTWSNKKGMRLRLNGGTKDTNSGIYMTFEMRDSGAAALATTIIMFLMAFYA